jgi:hypothetical protein
MNDKDAGISIILKEEVHIFTLNLNNLISYHEKRFIYCLVSDAGIVGIFSEPGV